MGISIAKNMSAPGFKNIFGWKHKKYFAPEISCFTLDLIQCTLSPIQMC